jgi:hypothetical protein
MGEYLARISFARNRLLVSDGGHPFDVEGIAAPWLKECEQLVSPSEFLQAAHGLANNAPANFPTKVIFSCFARDSLKHVRQMHL